VAAVEATRERMSAGRARAMQSRHVLADLQRQVDDLSQAKAQAIKGMEQPMTVRRPCMTAADWSLHVTRYYMSPDTRAAGESFGAAAELKGRIAMVEAQMRRTEQIAADTEVRRGAVAMTCFERGFCWCAGWVSLK
jgi:hypothetical protein